MIKFPTEYGIGELRVDQVAARECYVAMLEMEDHQQTLCIGEQRTVVEPIEELEEVTLDDDKNGHPGQPDGKARLGKLPDEESGHIHVEPRRYARNRSVSDSP